jgi:hypothetical protein
MITTGGKAGIIASQRNIAHSKATFAYVANTFEFVTFLPVATILIKNYMSLSKTVQHNSYSG